VADAAISGSGATLSPAENQSFTGGAATFTDANPYAVASQFTATINWGDGTTTSGAIAADPNVYAQFDVSGTHTYTQPGSFPVLVTISDAGGQSSTAQSTATVSSTNLALGLAATAAAGSFNTAVSGSGDTNTSSFDLGFGSLAAVNAATTTSTSSAPTPTTGAMTTSSNPPVPPSTSYSSSTTITESGPDWTLTETIGVSFVRTVTGNSTSGKFTESFLLTVSYHYHQADSYVFGA
ncbi:MAG: hypothetical protein ACYCYB_11935, partial [Candidatus Dormibacteria bacterium]